MKEDKELIQIRGSGGGKGGSANSTLNADDSMFSRQSASFVDILSEGPIKGLVYGESSIFFDDTRMRDINLATGEVSKDANFQNFIFITKDGSAEQTVNADFFNEFPTSSVVEAKSGAALQYNEPQYFTLSTSAFEKTNADYIKVNIYTNGMQLVILEDNPSSDVGYIYQDYSKGDIVSSYVDFDIEFRYIKADGTIVEKNLFDGRGGARNQAAGTGFSGKCSSKYVQTYGMNIEDIKNSDGFVDWAIKVTRKSPHETNASVKRMDDIFVESIEVSIADKLEYPYSAYVAGIFDAENFSAIPKRAYEIDGRIIDVPTNYVPCDYNGRKIKVEDVNASNHVFVVGETITDIKATLSSIHVEGNADNGYTATATTAAAHGLTIGKTFLVKITGVTGDNATFFNVEPAFATVTSTTNYTYVLETGTEALTGVTDDTSTAVPGTIVATYIWGGAVIDKIDATNDYLYLRDTGAQYTPITGATVTGGTSGAVTTISSDGTIELAFIPANYRRNPSTELITAQDQDWDGLYYSSWTNNPAWVFKDMLNNKVYGLGNYVTESEINKWELFSIGKYCDELVPAGIKAADFLSIYTTSDTNYTPAGSSGEYEPRFTSNLVLRSKAEAFKVINDMVTIFRGIIYWLNGELYVVQDSEKDPIYQFTNANVMGGEFTYEGSSFKTRTNQVIVKWNNPQDMYRQREEYIESEEILQQDTEFLKPSTMVAFGCTSRGQARRLGKWKLLTEKLNTNTVSFKTALNATFLQPGDIIRIVDKRKQGVSWGGRISSGTDLNTFVLDREFAIESGYTAADYEVIVTYSTSKALLAQDSATINIGGNITTLSRGDIIAKWRDSDNIIDSYTAVGSTSGSSTTITLTATPNSNIKVGMYITGTGITVGDTVTEINDTSITISNARTVSAATLTFGWRNTYTDDITIADAERAVNVFDTDKNNVLIQWTPSHHTEKSTLQSIDSTTDGRTTLSVATNYTATPVAEEVWLIQRNSLSTGKEELKAQLYRIITIQEAEKNTFEIGALEYNASKFDAVDKNEVIESYKTYNLPNSLDTVPPPTNLGFEVNTRLLSDGINVNTLSLFWDEPQDDEGRPYTFVQNYLVEYSTDDNLYIAAGYTQGTSFEITDIPSGRYYFRVYTVNIQGKKSVKATLDTGLVTFQQATPQDADGIGSQPFTINTTGTLPDSNLLLNTTTGLVSFSPTSFDYRAFGVTTSVSSQGNLDFSDLDDGETGYIYFDKSISKFLAIRWDSTGDSFYKVDEDPFATATGTIQHTGGSTTRTVTGSNTDFDAELGIYNKLKVTVSSVDYYPRVLRFSTTSPNTILVLNEPFAVNVPASTAFSKPTFLANYNTDSIFGEVTRTNSSTYSIALHGPIKGEDSYSINGTNENHSFTAAAGGTVDDFGTFTNDYTVIKGASIYSYAASGTAASTFGLSKSDSNCTTSISGAGQITCSALTQVAGKTTVTITDRASGATIATRIISFSKSLTGAGGSGSNAKTVKLTPNYHVLNYEEDDSEDVDITFSTEVQNTAGTVYYEFLVDGSTPAGGVQNGTTTTFALHQNDEPAIGGAVNVKVKIRETSTSAAVIATDTVTIYAVQDGSDAVIAFLTNQAHVVSASTDGTLASGALDDAGGTYKVFVGGTNKTTGNSVVYSKVSNTGCTAAINSSTGVYTISAIASDQATAVFQAVVPAAATGSIEVTHTADYSVSKSKVGTTGDTTYTWIKYGTDINGANLTDTYVAGTTTYIGHAYNKTTATESTNAGDYTWSKLEGDDGAVGLRTANGYLYYNTLQASAPGAPSNSSVQFAFNTGLLSGGVIGTGGTDWNQNAPTSTGGASSSKMWYVYWSTTEATAGGGTGTTVTLGSTVYNAHNFVGLVRFTGTNTIVDGSGETISLGSGGTTTIDGDAVTTGTIAAGRISTDLLRVTGTNFTGEHQGGEVGGWTIDSSSIYSGSKDLSGFTSNGAITLSSTGEIHTPTFYVESDGTSGFKGTVTISGTDLTTSNTLNANTVGSDLGGGYGDSSIGGLTLASTKIYIGTGTVNNTNTAFYVDNSGNMSLKDKLYWNGTTLAITGDLKITGSSTTLTETNTLNTNTTATNVGLGSVQDLDAQDQAQTGLIAGTTITGGGITLSSGGTIKGGQSGYDSGTGFFIGYTSSQYKFSIGNSSGNKLTWDGSTLSVAGNITVGNASTVRSALNVADGATDDTVANTKTTAAAAATAANSQDKTGGSVGGWTLGSTAISSASSSPKITIANEAHTDGPYILISE